MINLLTQYFIHPAAARHKEIHKCLYINYQNQHIDNIILFIDDNDVPVDNSKITYVPFNRRLHYIDCIKYANKYLTNEICIISNADIYYDNSLSKLHQTPLHNRLLAITRHEQDKNGRKKLWPSPEFCQDTWIFVPPIPEFGDFPMGKLGCDNRFAYEADDCGLEVINPALDIVCTHLHLSGHRTYSVDDKVPPPYKSDINITRLSNCS